MENLGTTKVQNVFVARGEEQMLDSGSFSEAKPPSS
jgi:hypothetical protein